MVKWPLGWLSDPFKGLSDLQLLYEKGTLNPLVLVFFVVIVPYFGFFVGQISVDFAWKKSRGCGWVIVENKRSIVASQPTLPITSPPQ